MNPIPFKYLETYEVTSLDKLLSMIPVTDEVTKEHEERMYEQDMLIMQYGAYAPVDPSLIFDDEEDADWGDEGAENDYSNMSPKELYQECKSRAIECKVKMPKAYYINLLEEDDKANEDWGDDEDEDDEDVPWEDED